MDPRPSGHSRPEIKSPAFRRSAVRGFARYPGPRADDAHVTPEDIEELRQLVHRPFPQPAPDPRDAIIVLAYTQPVPDRLSADHHRTEFVATEIPAILPTRSWMNNMGPPSSNLIASEMRPMSGENTSKALAATSRSKSRFKRESALEFRIADCELRIYQT